MDNPTSVPEPAAPGSGLARLWADLKASGWNEAVLRYATHALLLALVAGAIWVQRLNLDFLQSFTVKSQLDIPAPNLISTVTPAATAAVVVPTALPILADVNVLTRLIDPHTLVPARGRTEVITYTVQKGDTLFGIADNFNLQPETLLWGNYAVLKDDPHYLLPGQVLNILPVNGTYHYVTEGSTLDQIAKFYKVEPAAITDWSGNNLDPLKPQLQPNTWLVIPGGERELQAWKLPDINRYAKRTQANNIGQCPGNYTGVVGTGTFVWPTDNHTLSGYDYSAIHHGLDFRAKLGVPLYAVDHGVVTYAGPNDWGYGNLVMIDHGNGWVSVYGHLSQWNVVCGQSVYQGNLIGLAGNTGRSSGAHLHFELRYNGGYVNPWSVLGH